MLSYILIGLAGILALFLIVVAMQPSAFRIVRSASISAPPAMVFALVNDFHYWGAWSPWEKLDPALKRTYEGPAAGVGSIYSWTGDKRVGEGRMTILESRPSELIRIKLEFLKPFKATNTAVFSFKPGAGGTAVTWTMTGTNNFVFKAFGLLMNMDKMIGADFEKGLAAMKSAAESAKV